MEARNCPDLYKVDVDVHQSTLSVQQRRMKKPATDDADDTSWRKTALRQVALVLREQYSGGLRRQRI